MAPRRGGHAVRILFSSVSTEVIQKRNLCEKGFESSQ